MTSQALSVAAAMRCVPCREPLPQAMMRKLGIPLPTSALEDLEPDLQWETFKVSFFRLRADHWWGKRLLRWGQAELQTQNKVTKVTGRRGL